MSAMEVTEKLAAVYQSGYRYAFLQQSHRALDALPQAPDLAAITLRALVELGYGAPALELLRLRADLRHAAPQAEALQDSLATLPSGIVAWESRAEVFRRNLEALTAHRPQLAELAATLPRAVTGLELFQSPHGHAHTAQSRPGRLREWVHDLTSLEDDGKVQLPVRGQIPATAFIGVRSGGIMDYIRENTRELFLSYSHPLYLIEPDVTRLAAWMHLCDHTSLLDDPRVYVVAGPNALERLREILAENEHLAPPQLFIDQAGDAEYSAAVRAVVERVQEDRQRELAALTERLRTRYRDRDASYWADRFRPPGKILAVTSRFTTMLQYSTRDALAALRDMGYQTHLLIEEADHHQMNRATVCRAIERLAPTMVLILDHLRYEYPHMPENLPFLTWIQDPLPNLLSKRAGQSIGPLDFVCGILRPRCTAEFEYPGDRFVSVDVPVSAKVFHDAELDEEDRRRYDCDVSFVSNASMPIDRFHESAAAAYPAHLKPTLSLIYDRIVGQVESDACPQTLAREVTVRAMQDTGIAATEEDLEKVTTHYTYRLLDWGRRQQTLEWVARWAARTGRSLRLYGRGWEEHPTLASFAAGVIEHGEPLRKACRASRLSLQLIPSGFRHQRSYEILASGSLPLTRYCHSDFAGLSIEEFVRQREAGLEPNGEKLFPGLERVAFRTAEEFERVAESYLNDGALRGAVLADLRQVVMEHCTYDAAMAKVMRAFRKRLEIEAGRLAPV